MEYAFYGNISILMHTMKCMYTIEVLKFWVHMKRKYFRMEKIFYAHYNIIIQLLKQKHKVLLSYVKELDICNHNQ